MTARAQGSAVERAASLFTSIAAHEHGCTGADLTAIAEDQGLDMEQVWDGLSFLETCGMIRVVVRIEATARGVAAHCGSEGGN